MSRPDDDDDDDDVPRERLILVNVIEARAPPPPLPLGKKNVVVVVVVIAKKVVARFFSSSKRLLPRVTLVSRFSVCLSLLSRRKRKKEFFLSKKCLLRLSFFVVLNARNEKRKICVRTLTPKEQIKIHTRIPKDIQLSIRCQNIQNTSETHRTF